MTCNDFVEMIAEKSRENMNVYLSALTNLAMLAKEMELAEKIVLDGSSEMEETLKQIAQEFTTEHFAPQTVDKGGHWASLHDWASDKLLKEFSPKLAYRVDISYIETGCVYVEASSEEEAVILAQREIDAKGRDAIEPDEDNNVRSEDIQYVDGVYCIS